MIGGMYSKWSLALTLVCAVMIALSLGGALHAVIPHEHGPAADILPAIWQDLHAVVRHEGKDTLGAFTLPVALFSFSALVLLVLHPIRYQVVALYDPMRGRALRRGIVAYRKFS